VDDPRLLTALMMLLALTGVGTLGYRYIEGLDWIDALYMTVITLSTVGFREVVPLSHAGKLFTIVLIVFGIGMVLTIVGMWASMVIQGEFLRLFGRRRIERVLGSISNHYIVCGYGRFGRRVTQELAARGVRCVVIDRDAIVPETIPSVVGDATQDDVLAQAGIERARGILSTMTSEADNLCIALAAKELNPKIAIVARCENEANASRLSRAGASRIISPYTVAGHRMAQAILHPRMVEFFDLVTSPTERRMSVAEVTVAARSFCDGATLTEANIAARFGVTVLGVVGESGRLDLHPPADRRLAAGEVLLALGEEEALGKLSTAAGG